MTPKFKSQNSRTIVTGSVRSPHLSRLLNSVLQTAADHTISRLEAQGASVTFVESSAPEISPEQALVDAYGLVLLGGADVDPEFYGQEAVSDTIYGVSRIADEYEINLIEEAVRKGLSIFAICRGMQLVNVAYGGTLIQDVGSGSMHYDTADPSILTDHSVKIVPETNLSRIFGEGEFPIRSGHHQAIDELGNNLKVTASASDDIIEAIESEGDNWVLGVQWHPEGDNAPTEHFDPLLAALLTSYTS